MGEGDEVDRPAFEALDEQLVGKVDVGIMMIVEIVNSFCDLVHELLAFLVGIRVMIS